MLLTPPTAARDLAQALADSGDPLRDPSEPAAAPTERARAALAHLHALTAARTEVSGHSGESETSQVLAIDATLVDSPRLSPGVTKLDELSSRARLSRTKSPTSAVTFDHYAENGVLGDPRTATAESGHLILDEIVAKIVVYAEEMLRL